MILRTPFHSSPIFFVSRDFYRGSSVEAGPGWALRPNKEETGRLEGPICEWASPVGCLGGPCSHLATPLKCDPATRLFCLCQGVHVAFLTKCITDESECKSEKPILSFLSLNKKGIILGLLFQSPLSFPACCPLSCSTVSQLPTQRRGELCTDPSCDGRGGDAALSAADSVFPFSFTACGVRLPIPLSAFCAVRG